METKTIHLQNVTVDGEIVIPGDKSISHRAIMLGSIASGKTTAENFLTGEDCLNTAQIFRELGVQVDITGTDVVIESAGIQKWQSPQKSLDCGNSGTTARLLLGILAGSPVTATVVGDQYLSKRPMDRVVYPLRDMGAHITSEQEELVLPLTVQGTTLRAVEYTPPVASAQVKSAILFAGLQASGTTVVHELSKTRDHTERMMEQFGLQIDEQKLTVSLRGGQDGKATHVVVPGDISSAAFFIVAALIAKAGTITLKKVGLNETRTGILDVVQAMGGQVDIVNRSTSVGEPYGDLVITASSLTGTTIEEEALMPRLIDELPIIALLATQASGKTVIRNAAELRVKETDRITAVASQLNALGANIEELEDGMIIHGPTPLHGGVIDSYGDHRIGMMGAIAALVADGPIEVKDTACIAISYPQFFKHLDKVTQSSLQ